jgi:hypothetical protein
MERSSVLILVWSSESMERLAIREFYLQRGRVATASTGFRAVVVKGVRGAYTTGRKARSNPSKRRNA